MTRRDAIVAVQLLFSAFPGYLTPPDTAKLFVSWAERHPNTDEVFEWWIDTRTEFPTIAELNLLATKLAAVTALAAELLAAGVAS